MLLATRTPPLETFSLVVPSFRSAPPHKKEVNFSHLDEKWKRVQKRGAPRKLIGTEQQRRVVACKPQNRERGRAARLTPRLRPFNLFEGSARHLSTHHGTGAHLVD